MRYAMQQRAIRILFTHAAKIGCNRRDEKAVTAINMLIQMRIAVICSSVMIDLGWQLRHFRRIGDACTAKRGLRFNDQHTHK
jgi:uncharacterized membrane protein